MSENRYEVVGIGNAIVDVLAYADDAFITDNALARGSMTLIDADQAEVLYDKMGQTTEMSGGSAGNTMAGFASLGGRGAYIGRVADDQLGKIFAHDVRAVGVDFYGVHKAEGLPTGRCLVFITPDAERTMNTFLGACVELGPEDIDPTPLENTRLAYLEGYLWDKPAAKKAVRKAAEIARGAGAEVALTLSDRFCVDRHKADFLSLIDEHIDILFANEEEIMALYDAGTLDQAVEAVRGRVGTAAITRGAEGAVLVQGDQTVQLPAAPVDKVVDTTGAGDLYASGFLFGHARGLGLEVSGRIAAIAAAEVISHIGPRPQRSLAELARPAMAA